MTTNTTSSITNAQQLIDYLQPHFLNATIEAINQGNKFDVRIIDDTFANKRTVQRQQMVYTLVSEFISNGDIHALNIQALTPSEWQNKS